MPSNGDGDHSESYLPEAARPGSMPVSR